MLRRFWENWIAGPWRWRNPADRMAFYLVHVYGFDGRCPCRSCTESSPDDA